ncbi:MAG: Hpt domain-containing protein [Gammaproteobacteria bacterium]|nr:Hpt domain-containing protein [Gammaproteobacteria bacterium]MDH3507719.1 Hpt domain-containing protein [Gammaproteobacteria bacterium]
MADKAHNPRRDVSEYRITPADEPGRRLLCRYLERRRTELDELRRALAARDFQLIARIGHNLRGSGSAYELVRISQLGGRLEDAAGKPGTTALVGIIADLETFLDSVIVGDPSSA